MDAQIADKIRHILVNDLFVELPMSQLDADAGLQSQFGLDSLGFTELRLLAEKAFDVKIDDAHFTPEHFSSIRGVANLVSSLKHSAAPRAT